MIDAFITVPHGDPYPVLYLLHGYSDAEDAWVSVGRAHVILDNLMAQGKVKPMVVVMPYGYGNDEVISNGWAGLSDQDVPSIWREIGGGHSFLVWRRFLAVFLPMPFQTP